MLVMLADFIARTYASVANDIASFFGPKPIDWHGIIAALEEEMRIQEEALARNRTQEIPPPPSATITNVPALERWALCATFAVVLISFLVSFLTFTKTVKSRTLWSFSVSGLFVAVATQVYMVPDATLDTLRSLGLAACEVFDFVIEVYDWYASVLGTVMARRDMQRLSSFVTFLEGAARWYGTSLSLSVAIKVLLKAMTIRPRHATSDAETQVDAVQASLELDVVADLDEAVVLHNYVRRYRRKPSIIGTAASVKRALSETSSATCRPAHVLEDPSDDAATTLGPNTQDAETDATVELSYVQGDSNKTTSTQESAVVSGRSKDVATGSGVSSGRVPSITASMSQGYTNTRKRSTRDVAIQVDAPLKLFKTQRPPDGAVTANPPAIAGPSVEATRKGKARATDYLDSTVNDSGYSSNHRAANTNVSPPPAATTKTVPGPVQAGARNERSAANPSDPNAWTPELEWFFDNGPRLPLHYRDIESTLARSARHRTNVDQRTIVKNKLFPNSVWEPKFSGSFGAVYKVRSSGILRRPIAVKRISLRTAKDRKMAREELRNHQMLSHGWQHPNLIRYFTHCLSFEGEQNNNPRSLDIVMKYIPGNTLHELIGELRSRDARLCVLDTERIMLQMASVIDYLHTHGFIHADIKPENVGLNCALLVEDNEESRRRGYRIMRLYRNEIILFDLGLMVRGPGPHKSGRGTLLYSAPEVMLGLPWSLLCDVWSLGVLMLGLMSAGEYISNLDNIPRVLDAYLLLRLISHILLKKPIPQHMVEKVGGPARKWFEDGCLRNQLPDNAGEYFRSIDEYLPQESGSTDAARHNRLVSIVRNKLLNLDPDCRISMSELQDYPGLNAEFDW